MCAMCVRLNLYVVRLRSNNRKRPNRQTTNAMMLRWFIMAFGSISINRNNQVTQCPYKSTLTHVHTHFFFWGGGAYFYEVSFSLSLLLWACSLLKLPNRPLCRLFNLDSNSSPLIEHDITLNSLTSRIVCPTFHSPCKNNNIDTTHLSTGICHANESGKWLGKWSLKNGWWRNIVCLFIWLWAGAQNVFNYNVQYVLIGVKCILKLLNAYANGRFNTADNGKIRCWMGTRKREKEAEHENLLELYLNAEIIRLVWMRVQTGSQRSQQRCGSCWQISRYAHEHTSATIIIREMCFEMFVLKCVCANVISSKPLLFGSWLWPNDTFEMCIHP